jgi:hypothetical protein
MAIAAPSPNTSASSSAIVDQEVEVLPPHQYHVVLEKVTWPRAGKIVWTVIAVVLHLVGAFSVSGWIAFFILLHLVCSITIIWRDTHG